MARTATTTQSRIDATAAKLTELIVSRRLLPNQRLVEVELSEMLETNRANIRTALALLEQTGLVVSTPNRGARVRLVTGDEALEIMEARGALEILVVRRAAERATKADRAKIRRLLTEMRTALRAGDLILYSDLNGKLHEEFYRIASMPTVARLLTSLKSQLVRFNYRPALIPGRAQQSLVEHTELAEAVCAGDPRRAEKALREHLKQVLVALQKIIRDNERTFL